MRQVFSALLDSRLRAERRRYEASVFTSVRLWDRMAARSVRRSAPSEATPLSCMRVSVGPRASRSALRPVKGHREQERHTGSPDAAEST